MKTRPFVSIGILALLFVVSVSFAEEETSFDQTISFELLYGTWVNEDYNEVWWPWGKVTFNPDGTFAYYGKSNDTKPTKFGTFILKDSWIDSEGNMWILEDEYVGPYFEGKKVSKYVLNKISTSGATLESVLNSSNGGRYPEEKDLNPNNSYYQIHYFQE